MMALNDNEHHIVNKIIHIVEFKKFGSNPYQVNSEFFLQTCVRFSNFGTSYFKEFKLNKVKNSLYRKDNEDKSSYQCTQIFLKV